MDYVNDFRNNIIAPIDYDADFIIDNGSDWVDGRVCIDLILHQANANHSIITRKSRLGASYSIFRQELETFIYTNNHVIYNIFDNNQKLPIVKVDNPVDQVPNAYRLPIFWDKSDNCIYHRLQDDMTTDDEYISEGDKAGWFKANPYPQGKILKVAAGGHFYRNPPYGIAILYNDRVYLKQLSGGIYNSQDYYTWTHIDSSSGDHAIDIGFCNEGFVNSDSVFCMMIIVLYSDGNIRIRGTMHSTGTSYHLDSIGTSLVGSIPGAYKLIYHCGVCAVVTRSGDLYEVFGITTSDPTKLKKIASNVVYAQGHFYGLYYVTSDGKLWFTGSVIGNPNNTGHTHNWNENPKSVWCTSINNGYISTSQLRLANILFDRVALNGSYTSTTWSEPKTFYWKVAFKITDFEFDGYLPKRNVVNYVTTWGTSEDTATANTFSSKSMTFTAENYDRYNELLEEAAQAEIAACKAMLDIPDVVLPANTTQNYTVGECTFKLDVNHAKGSEKNVVVTTCYIDNKQYGTSVTSTFATQAAADTDLASLSSTKIAAMKALCDLMPVTTNENYTYDGNTFKLTVRLYKYAGTEFPTCALYINNFYYGNYQVNMYGNIATNGSTFCNNISTRVITGNINNTLKPAVNTHWVTSTTEEYSIGDVDFRLTVQSTAHQLASIDTNGQAALNNNFITLVAKCDNVQCDSTTFRGFWSSTEFETRCSSAKSSRDSMIQAMKDYLSTHVANPTVQVQTTDGWKFNLVQNITKTSNNTTATASAKLDGNRYGTTNGSLRYDTIDNDTRVLWASAKDSEDVLKAIIAECPTNYSEVYTVNSFNYNIGTQYVKVEGETFVTINTMLDGEVWKSQTQNISVANLASNINSAKSIAATDLEELRVFLRNQTPANSDNSAYVVDGFSYNCGVEYSKNANTGAVTGTVKLDGVTMDTITGTLHAATFASDMSDIITRATTSVNSVKSGLIGLTPDIEEYDKNGTAFNLKVTYTKNANGTITIQPFIDGDAYGSPYIVEYDYTKGDVYRAKGQEFISNMKTSVNQASAAYTDTSETYTVNGLSFTVGIKFEKEPGEALVNVFQMLDGKKVGSPSQVDYDVTNTSNATVQAAQDLTTLKTRLNASPANYANVVTYGGFSFAVGSSFEKAAGEDTVHIKTMLDGVQYGNTINQNFNISDINDLLEVADQYETALKDVLTTVPRDETETFTIRRFNFLLGKHYSKQANSHLVTTMVKLDSVQYDQYHQENFDPSTIGTLTTYNDALMQALKNKLLQVTPDDIHTTYSRNQFNFNIDAYFSKQANSDVVNIEYTIDSGDLSGNSTVTFSSSSTEEELQSAATSLASTMDSTVEEVSSLLHELTYNASEEVAAKVLGPRVLSDNNDNS